jgi:type II secretory pathway component PulJ
VAQDPTTWQDVALVLAGAPIGAAIAVAGVMLTNRSNRASQDRQLQAQLTQQRQALEHDLKSEHHRRVLSVRADLYAEALNVCESADAFVAWIEAANENGAIPDPDDEDLFSRVSKPLRDCRGKVAVYCAAEVREEVFRMSKAVEEFSHDWETANSLLLASARLRECVIKAAVLDRTSGLQTETPPAS